MIERSKVDEFFKEIKHFQPINDYFSQFQIEELFSNDCEIMHECFEKLNHFPNCLLDYNKNFNSSFLAKYISIALPTEITDQLLMDLSYFIDKLTNQDLNFIVPVIASRLNVVQKAIALFNFPDCAATFVLLSSLLNNENYFILAFQRIYSSFHLVPSICHRIINSSLKLSIFKGPARSQILGMFPILIRSYKTQNFERGKSPLEIVFEGIIDCHPRSTELLSNNELETLVSMLTKLPKLPYQALIFFELINVHPGLTIQQVNHLITQSPEILFNYMKKIPLDCSEDIFASMMDNIASIPFEFPNKDFILIIYKHILLFSLEDHSHIRFMFQSNVQWFHQTLKKMKGDRLDVALFGINLLMLRSFNSYSNIFLECENLSELILDTLNRFNDKYLFIDAFFYALDPENTKCPFEEIIQLEVLKTLKFPPPSTSFIYHIVPVFLRSLLLSCSSEDSSLKHLIRCIIPLYKNFKLNKFLSSISNSDNLNHLVKLAMNDDEVFEFVSLTLGYSCNFDVFHELFNSISQDLNKTLNFFAFLSESSQLVTEFLYVNQEIPMPLSSSSTSIAMWIRPISGISPLLQITANRVNISMRISPESFYPSEIQEIKLPTSIDGWYFITMTFFQFNTLLISVNLTIIKAVYQNAIFPCSNFLIGGKNANFELQSVRVFKTVLSDDDYYQLFSLGPNYNEMLYRDFISYPFQKVPTFVRENGFISHYYLPFIHKLSKRTKYDNNPLNNLEYALLPPYKMVYQSSKPFFKSDSIELNLSDFRCITSSFLNSLHCHGGMNLIIHFIAEVILKNPSLNNLLFSKFLKNVFNRFPVFNAFFENNKAYQLIGHLLWSGNTTASETINLAMTEYNDSFYLTNPKIIENWLFEGQIYFSEFSEVIEKMMNSLMIPWNLNILVNINSFEKIVNLLCGTSIHTDHFLNVLYMLAVKLTSLEKAESNSRLVFERLMLCHFVFSRKEKNKETQNKKNENLNIVKNRPNSMMHSISFNHDDIHPTSTVYLIRILNLLLSQYPKVKVDLELFLPAILTSVPVIQAEIIKILIVHLEWKYLHFLSYILKELPFIKEIGDSISTLIQESVIPLSFVQITTCLTYLISHVELKDLALKLCSHATISTTLVYTPITSSLLLSDAPFSSVNTTDESNIAFNQTIECIAITEQKESLLHFDENQETADFISFLICSGFISGKYELVSLFFSSIYTIPNLPTNRYVMIILFFMIRTFKVIWNHQRSFNLNTNQDEKSESYDIGLASSLSSCSLLFVNINLDKVIEMSTSYVSFLIHKMRLTPGSIDEAVISLLEEYSFSLLDVVKLANSNDSTSNLIFLLISMFHIKFSQNYIEKLSSLINDVPRIQKAKRYQELIDRIEQPESMIPVTFQEPFSSSFKQIEKKWQTYSEVDKNGLFSICCRSIHQQNFSLNTFQLNNSDNDEVIDLWHSIFRSLQFPGSSIYSNCPAKWMISDCPLNYKQRKILFPLNPSIDRLYESFWSIKYKDEELPSIRLKLTEVLQFTPISLDRPQDVRFSSSAHHLSGISNFVGILILTANKIKFYRRSKPSKPSNNDLNFLDFISIKLCQINSIRLKKFHHQPTGIEILCEDNHSFIFSFDNSNNCDTFIDTISQLTSYNITIIKTVNFKEIQNVMQKWIDGTISNFDYLLFLNEQSGRSWNDLTQYPIFPWVLKDYSSKQIDLDDQSIYRDLSLPIFAQTAEQQEQCMKYYKTTMSLSKEEDGHCMPNYFSNVGCTLYYLVRLEPFTDEEISFQGGSFDAADRTFQSFDISYNIMVSYGNKDSLELIPDFFFNPETLKNINNAKFPDSILCNRVVNDVILPPWASSHRELVKMMRNSLESKVTSLHLHEWIDLVFGFRRRGQAALEKFNVFQKSVFEFNVDEVIDNRTLFKAMRDQIHNCGQAANELFKSPHPKRNVLNELHIFNGNLVNQPIKKSSIPKKELKFAFNPDGWTKVDSKIFNDNDSGNKPSYLAFKINHGNLECLLPQNAHQFLCFCDELKTTAIDIKGNFLLTGHKLPIVNIWSLKNEKTPVILSSINCHESPVSAVSFFGNDWPIIAAGHDDGYVSLFSMNPMRFLRSMSMGFNIKVSLIRTSNLTGEILIVQKKYLTLWTINGELVNSIQINDNIIDATFTNFTDGLRANFIFLLCENGNILSLNSFDMNIISYQTNNEDKEKPISLCFRIDSLYVQYADSSITCWKLI